MDNTRTRFKDFDEAIAESQPISFKMCGRDYELPAQIPADLVWTAMRAGDLQTREHALQLSEKLIGRDRMDQMLADGATLEQIMQLLVWVAGQYKLDVEQVANEGADDGAPK